MKFESEIGEQRLGISPIKLNRLLTRARHQGPEAPVATARSFVDWVYQLDHGAPAEPQGPRSPSFLAEARRKIANVLDRNADRDIEGWDLVSCDDGSGTGVVYSSPVLSFGGLPLRMRPDAVFRHRTSHLLAIFEYKIPSFGVTIPNNGWPNLATQLWAYSLLDPWHKDPNVLLISALFNWDGRTATLGAVRPRTVKKNPEFISACAQLFVAWGGHIDARNLGGGPMSQLLKPFSTGS